MENTEVTKIPFSVNRFPDSTKPVGEEITVQDGVDGTRTVISVDGHVTSDRTIAPKNAIVYYGTREDEEITPVSPQEETAKQPSQNVEMGTNSFIPPITGYLYQQQGGDKEDGGILSKLIHIRNTMNGNALFVRAFKTFVQAGLATWAVTGFDFTTGAIIGAVAAGISALMNLFIKPTEA